VMLEVGDEVLVKIRLQKLPAARDWPGLKPKSRQQEAEEEGDDMLLQDSEVPRLTEGWRDLSSDQLKKGEGLVVWTPFSGSRNYVSEQLIHKKSAAAAAARSTGDEPANEAASSGMAMGFQGWAARTETQDMPPPGTYKGVKAAQSCTALPAGEYSWPAASATAGAWCVRVLDDGRLELRYGGASSAGAPAWAATFGILLGPGGDVRCLDGHGKMTELHRPSQKSIAESVAKPFAMSPSLDPESGGLAGGGAAAAPKKKAAAAPKPKPKPKASPAAAASASSRPDPSVRGAKPKRSARAIAERLANEKAEAERAKAAAAFFAAGASASAGGKAGGGGPGGGLRPDSAREQQQRSFFDNGRDRAAASGRGGGFGGGGGSGGGSGGGGFGGGSGGGFGGGSAGGSGGGGGFGSRQQSSGGGGAFAGGGGSRQSAVGNDRQTAVGGSGGGGGGGGSGSGFGSSRPGGDAGGGGSRQSAFGGSGSGGGSQGVAGSAGGPPTQPHGRRSAVTGWN
jgi:hypothetical protein